MKAKVAVYGLLLSLLVGCVQHENRDKGPLHDLIWGSWVRLQIAPTFEAPIEYELNQHAPYYLIYTEYSGAGGYDWGEKVKVLRISLSPEEHESVKQKISSALEAFPIKDEVMGPDGTIWVLESNLYTYTKVAAWTPEYETEVRGYPELLQLEGHLRDLVSLYDR